MRQFRFLFVAGFLALTACNHAKVANDANFTLAINEYLSKHGEACTVIGRQFPVDLPLSESGRYGIEPKLVVLEQAGLVHASDSIAVVHAMLDPLRGRGPAQPVKHYELTEAGRKYFQQIPSALGQTTGFCYGQKTVDAIVKWTEPVTTGVARQAEVTYTYKIAGAATWAARADVQQAFSDIQTTINGVSRTTEVAGLQLTSEGWEVPGQ